MRAHPPPSALCVAAAAVVRAGGRAVAYASALTLKTGPLLVRRRTAILARGEGAREVGPCSIMAAAAAAEKVSCNKGAYPVNGVGKGKGHRLSESLNRAILLNLPPIPRRNPAAV